MSRTEGQGRAWSLWLVGVLLVLRLVIAPWGDILIFNNSVDFMAEAKLPIGDLIMGRYPGIVWPQPGSYPVLLKLLGTTQPDDPVTRKAILVFNVLLSTATLGLVSLAGRRIFPGERARVGWALFFFAFSLTEFVYPWEVCALAEVIATNVILLIAVALGVMLSPPELRWRLLFPLLPLLAFLGHLRESLLLVAPALLLALVLVRREERSPDDRRVSSPGFSAFAGVIAALTLVLYLHTGLRASARELNLGNFVSMRVLPDPAARDALARDPALPASVVAMRGVPFWSWVMDAPGWAWVRKYSTGRHVPFLVGHPFVTFHLFRKTSLDIISRIGTNEQYRWYTSAHNQRPETILLSMSYLVNRLVCAPILALWSINPDLCLWLPVVLLVAFGIAGARLGSMCVSPLLVFLCLVAYSQYAVTALFEGTEDYRHAVVGSEALLCLYWLSAATAVAGWRERRRSAAAW